MAKFVSYAYSPGASSYSRAAEMALLRREFPLIIRNLEHILRTPRFFFCLLKSAYVSTPWLFGGGGPAPFGVLAILWEDGSLLYQCPKCAGHFYALGAAGGFSGGRVWGICTDCRKGSEFDVENWPFPLVAIGRLLALYRNEPIIETGEQPRFDWKDGLKGATTPDRIILPAVGTVDLGSLLTELRAADTGAMIPDEGTTTVPPHNPNARSVVTFRKG